MRNQILPKLMSDSQPTAWFPIVIVLLAFGTLTGLPKPVTAQQDRKSEMLFQESIRPILQAKCFSCHGPKTQKSSYRLDVREIALQGGDHGEPPIVPGDKQKSLLLQYVSDENSDLAMPPSDSGLPRLTSEEVEQLRQWIEGGADWPDSANTLIDDPRNWWSFQPITQMPLTVATNPIDHFVNDKLSQAGLKMSPPAEPRTLARRLYFDLIGLPPTPDALDAFERDYLVDSEKALNGLVENLLALPQYGERWARHWLDVVHYGDTHGYDKDKPRAYAWPYRDYVIRALNSDKPYAKFIEEQIAGDILWPETVDGIEALGFIAAGPWDFIGHAEVPETKTDGKIARHLDRDDMVSNTIGTFCSLTIHCAQCHQHKFDPISQEDYYRLHAVFAALDRTDRKYHRNDATQKQFFQLTQAKSDLEESLEEIEEPLRDLAGEKFVTLSQRIEEATQTKDKQKLIAEREALLISFADAEAKQRRAELKSQLAQVDEQLESLPAPSMVYAGGIHSGKGNFVGTGPSGGKPRSIFVLARGQVTQPMREVAPGALSALDFQPFQFSIEANSYEGERRVALAHWITDRANPLTWRSIVNRVWLYHFGRGIVDTPNDFGHNGSLPSHPELLDWLAVEFRDSGGSLKRLHKLIVTSQTYRQASAHNAQADKIDSGNRLLWKQNRRRLEAEAIRDSVLAVSGKLDLSMAGPGWQDFVIEHPEHSPHYEYALADPEDPRTWRRSVYRFIVRSQTQPWMTSLDCADPSMRVDKRNESLSSIQALALLNNGFMLTQAKHFADRVARSSEDLALQVDAAYRMALGTAPTDSTRAQLVEFTERNGLPYLCRLLFNLNAFTFVD